MRACYGLLVAITFLAACGVQLDAPEISLVIQDDGIVFADADASSSLPTGETIIKIANDSAEAHRIVLAHVDQHQATPRRLPRSLIEADAARDDERILGMTSELEPKEVIQAGGGFGHRIARATFHVHLQPDRTYVLFDVYGGLERGVFIRLVPGGGS